MQPDFQRQPRSHPLPEEEGFTPCGVNRWTGSTPTQIAATVAAILATCSAILRVIASGPAIFAQTTARGIAYSAAGPQGVRHVERTARRRIGVVRFGVAARGLMPADVNAAVSPAADAPL